MSDLFNEDGTLNRQEAFDRAWKGLESQGWKTAEVETPPNLRMYPGQTHCLYLTPDGCRCAWGWVDPEATGALQGDDAFGSVFRLREQGVGIAARLKYDDAEWARSLQKVHDSGPHFLKRRLRGFAREHGLAFPKDADD